MSQIGNVNGWPLLAMPATPGPRTVEWTADDVVADVTNPYTLKQQIQNWQAGLLGATVTLPPMQRALAAPWIAFLTQTQGQNAVFYFGDGLGGMAQGTAEGLGVIQGIFQGPYSLTTSGWDVNQFGLLLPGDWLQVGYQLFMCLDQVNSDGAGNASFAVWPQVRVQPASGTPVVTTNPQGLFRMKANRRTWNESYLRTYGLSFQIREAF